MYVYEHIAVQRKLRGAKDRARLAVWKFGLYVHIHEWRLSHSKTVAFEYFTGEQSLWRTARKLLLLVGIPNHHHSFGIGRVALSRFAYIDQLRTSLEYSLGSFCFSHCTTFYHVTKIRRKQAVIQCCYVQKYVSTQVKPKLLWWDPQTDSLIGQAMSLKHTCLLFTCPAASPACKTMIVASPE